MIQLTRVRSRSWAQLAFALACVIAIAIHWAVIAHRRATHLGDFDVSREFGRRFLAGEDLYKGGLHYPYLPTAALYFAPLATVDPGLGIALRYTIAVLSLWLTFRMLRTMVTRSEHEDSSKGVAVSALTLVLASHYIIRDLDDGGPHLILLAVLVGGIYLVWRGRDRLGAISFALGTALKVTPGLFLPFFAWKRRWHLLGYTAIATAIWIVLPVLWMGPTSWWRQQHEWIRFAVGSTFGSRAPGVEASEERVQNQALRYAVKRYLMTFPEGHPLRLPHPRYIPVLKLDPAVADRLATGVMLGLLIFFGWRGRRAYDGLTDPTWLVECSAVLILTLLLSPVTWVQHMVLMVPALYLISEEWISGKTLGAPATSAMVVYVVLALLMNREVLGRENYILFLSYYPHTLCMLLVLGVVLLRRPTVTTAPMSGAAASVHGRS